MSMDDIVTSKTSAVYEEPSTDGRRVKRRRMALKSPSPIKQQSQMAYSGSQVETEPQAADYDYLPTHAQEDPIVVDAEAVLHKRRYLSSVSLLIC